MTTSIDGTPLTAAEVQVFQDNGFVKKFNVGTKPDIQFEMYEFNPPDGDSIVAIMDVADLFDAVYCRKETCPGTHENCPAYRS
jgi:hypothetical protein